MNYEELKIKIDPEDVKRVIQGLMDSRTVLLPASAVQRLWDFYGVSPADLESCGAIVAKESKQ